MRKVVIYHGGGCADGFASAWLFHHAFPDAEFVAAQYGEAPCQVTDADVYLVDFSYLRGTMEWLRDRNRCVTVLDHHKTAEAELAGLDDSHDPLGKCRVTFDMVKSGGRLAWEYLWDNGHLRKQFSPECSRDRATWIVDYTEDRDLWAWKLPESHAVNAALRSYPMTFEWWDKLSQCNPGRLGLEGTAILRSDQRIVDQHVKNARDEVIAGHAVRVVNATTHISEIAGELAKGQPFGVCWFRRADGKFIYSLRSRGDGGLDVSEIAKSFGGGGHRNAAGFEADSILGATA